MQVKPNEAAIAITHLERQKYLVFHPTVEVRKIRRHRVQVTAESLFPGYVFIQLHDDQRWAPINSTRSCVRLLTRPSSVNEYLEPVPIDDFVEQLRSCCRHDKAAWVLPIGCQVRITSGPFRYHEGTITGWSSAERCRLLLWLMGQDVKVEISAADIVAV